MYQMLSKPSKVSFVLVGSALLLILVGGLAYGLAPWWIGSRLVEASWRCEHVFAPYNYDLVGTMHFQGEGVENGEVGVVVHVSGSNYYIQYFEDDIAKAETALLVKDNRQYRRDGKGQWHPSESSLPHGILPNCQSVYGFELDLDVASATRGFYRYTATSTPPEDHPDSEHWRQLKETLPLIEADYIFWADYTGALVRFEELWQGGDVVRTIKVEVTNVGEPNVMPAPELE